MPGPHPKGLVEAAALAVATGHSIPKWAESNGVSARTVQRWATKPAFHRRVNELRRRMSDRTIGILTAMSTAAAAELAKLATKGQTEQIRLVACRAILSDLLAISNHAEIKVEIEELKKGLAEQTKRREKRP